MKWLGWILFLAAAGFSIYSYRQLGKEKFARGQEEQTLSKLCLNLKELWTIAKEAPPKELLDSLKIADWLEPALVCLYPDAPREERYRRRTQFKGELANWVYAPHTLDRAQKLKAVFAIVEGN